MTKFYNRPTYSQILCFCFVIHVHISGFCFDACSQILKVFKLCQWRSCALCSLGILYHGTDWLVPSILGQHASPTFKGQMSNEECCKRWLAQRYLLGTHPHQLLPEPRIGSHHHPSSRQALLVTLVVGPEPCVMGTVSMMCWGWSPPSEHQRLMVTVRGRFIGCLNPPVRTAKTSEKLISVTCCISRQPTASSVGSCPRRTSEVLACHSTPEELPASHVLLYGTCLCMLCSFCDKIMFVKNVFVLWCMYTYFVFLFCCLLIYIRYLLCGRGSDFLVWFCDTCLHTLYFCFVVHIHRFYAVDLDVRFHYHTDLHIKLTVLLFI